MQWKKTEALYNFKMFPMIFNTECTLGYNLGKKQHLVSKIPHAEDLLYVGDFFFFLIII